MENNKRRFGIGMGMASLLMVMVILCISILTVMTSLQVRNESQSYAEKYQAIDNYYAADAKAIKIYANIEEILYYSYINTTDDAYVQSCRIALSDQGYTLEGNQISYEVSIDDTHVLAVKLELTDRKSTERLKIIEWKMIVKDQGDYDGTEFDT